MNIELKYGFIQGKLGAILDQLDDLSDEEKLSILAEYSQLQTEVDGMYIGYLQQEHKKQVKNQLVEIQESLKPVTKFFDKPLPKSTKKLTAKQKKQQELEEYERMMDAKALSSIKKGT